MNKAIESWKQSFLIDFFKKQLTRLKNHRASSQKTIKRIISINILQITFEL